MEYYRDLREFLDILDRRGKLRVISPAVNKDTEIHPLVRWQFRGLREEDRFGFLFETPTDSKGTRYPCRVASSVISPCREVYALSVGCPLEEVHERWGKALASPLPARHGTGGPVKEEIHKDGNLLEHGGLEEFAIPMSTNGWEAFPRITAGGWVSKDPDDGVLNVGMYNAVLLDPLRTNCRVGPGHHLRLHWEKCRQKGVPLEVALVVGAVPVLPILSAADIPYGVSEFEVAGALVGHPLELVPCETVDLEVPATAEIVIEGTIPTDYMEPDAPSGENLGYTILGDWVYSFRVQCITHRKNPIWHDLVCEMPPSESSTMRSVTNEGRVLSLLRTHAVPQVKNVAFHHCGSARRLCVIQFHDLGGVRTHNSVVWQALFAAMSVAPDWPKIVIAVDEDIDPWDLESVFWAVCTRLQPHRDTKLIQGRRAGLDQSAGSHHLEKSERYYPSSRVGPQGASAMLMDATRKWDYTPVSLPRRDYMERGRELWEKLGLGPLSPKAPWHGVSLGNWPEGVARLVELSEQGRREEAAQDLMNRGKTI